MSDNARSTSSLFRKRQKPKPLHTPVAESTTALALTMDGNRILKASKSKSSVHSGPRSPTNKVGKRETSPEDMSEEAEL